MWNFAILCLLGYGIWAAMRSQAEQSRPAAISSRDRLQGWKALAERCGLQVKESTAVLSPQLVAQSEQVKVRIEACGIGGQETRIEVEAPAAPDFQEVSILPQSGSAMWDITIGDPGFDGQFVIKGSRRQIFALLDADTRRRMRAVNAAGQLEISPGRILAIVGEERVSDALPSLLAIHKRLATPIDVLRSLVENARRDSESGVRLENLLVLIQELPGDPATVEALRAACSDRLPTIRLRAAKELGAAESRDVLLELANGLEDDAWSAEAVSILDRELPVERVKALLDRAWSTGRLRTALACVKVLGHSGAAAVEPLSELPALQNAELAAAAATALGATDSPAAEPWLIPALQSEHEVVRVAAAKALRRVGSVAAVLPLKEAQERSSWLDVDFHQATRQAMAEIQSRVQGGSPGQLSLTEEAGRLSLADEPAGRLSISGEAPEPEP